MSIKKKSTVTLERIGFMITGKAMLEQFGGAMCESEMTPYIVKHLNPAEIWDLRNSGGIICNDVTKIKVNIYDLYQNGYKELRDRCTIKLKKDGTLYCKGSLNSNGVHTNG